MGVEHVRSLASVGDSWAGGLVDRPSLCQIGRVLADTGCVRPRGLVARPGEQDVNWICLTVFTESAFRSIQSISLDVCLLSVCPLLETPLPGELETSPVEERTAKFWVTNNI